MNAVCPSLSPTSSLEIYLTIIIYNAHSVIISPGPDIRIEFPVICTEVCYYFTPSQCLALPRRGVRHARRPRDCLPLKFSLKLVALLDYLGLFLLLIQSRILAGHRLGVSVLPGILSTIADLEVLLGDELQQVCRFSSKVDLRCNDGV